MSYILDALKKSEQERNKGKVPTIDTIQDSQAGIRKSGKPPWVLIAVSAIALNLLLFGIWMYSEKSEGPPQRETLQTAAVNPAEPEQLALTPENTEVPLTENEPPSTASPEPGSTISSVNEVGPEPTLPVDGQAGSDETLALSRDENEQVNPEIDTETAVDQNAAEDEGSENVIEADTEAVKSAGTEMAVEGLVSAPGTDTAASDPETMSSATQAAGTAENIEELSAETAAAVEPKDTMPIPWEKLSADIKSSLPTIRISLHYYSSVSTSSKVSINGRMMREGYEIGNGLAVKEITKNGVIFSFGDTLFSYSVFSR